MKIIFLDIDGVLNTSETISKGVYIDPERVKMIRDIQEKTGAELVLSSDWRHTEQGRQAAIAYIGEFIGRTPDLRHEDKANRGREIEEWVIAHPEVEKYAIVDDRTDFLITQGPNFFHCHWDEGLTQPLADKILKSFED